MQNALVLPMSTPNNFSFPLTALNFGSANYNYEIRLTGIFNTSTGGTITLQDNSANVGSDVIFENCCFANINLISPINDVLQFEIDQRKSSDFITAANTINIDAEALYSAGNS